MGVLAGYAEYSQSTHRVTGPAARDGRRRVLAEDARVLAGGDEVRVPALLWGGLALVKIYVDNIDCCTHKCICRRKPHQTWAKCILRRNARFLSVFGAELDFGAERATFDAKYTLYIGAQLLERRGESLQQRRRLRLVIGARQRRHLRGRTRYDEYPECYHEYSRSTDAEATARTVVARK